MSDTATILIVDDNREIRDSLALYLKKNGRRPLLAENADVARRILRDSRVDVVVLDIMMPGEDGLSLCRYLSANESPPVILLSARGEEVDRILGLEIGADDYVVKPFSPRELMARIDAVIRRSRALPPGIEEPKAEQISFGRWALMVAERALVDADGNRVPLSTSEYRLLMVFLERPRIVLSREQLLDLVHGRSAEPFDRAMDTLVSRLRRKIEDDQRDPRLIKTVWGGGYMFSARPERGEAALGVLAHTE
jgi:two-component system OmpR family response regulator